MSEDRLPAFVLSTGRRFINPELRIRALNRISNGIGFVYGVEQLPKTAKVPAV
jgi:hypothetical protein